MLELLAMLALSLAGLLWYHIATVLQQITMYTLLELKFCHFPVITRIYIKLTRSSDINT